MKKKTSKCKTTKHKAAKRKVSKRPLHKRKNPTVGQAKTSEAWLKVLPPQVIYAMREYLDEMYSDHYGTTEPGEILFNDKISDKGILLKLAKEMPIREFLEMYQAPDFRSELRKRTIRLRQTIQ